MFRFFCFGLLALSTSLQARDLAAIERKTAKLEECAAIAKAIHSQAVPSGHGAALGRIAAATATQGAAQRTAMASAPSQVSEPVMTAASGDLHTQAHLHAQARLNEQIQRTSMAQTQANMNSQALAQSRADSVHVQYSAWVRDASNRLGTCGDKLHELRTELHSGLENLKDQVQPNSAQGKVLSDAMKKREVAEAQLASELTKLADDRLVQHYTHDIVSRHFILPGASTRPLFR